MPIIYILLLTTVVLELSSHKRDSMGDRARGTAVKSDTLRLTLWDGPQFMPVDFPEYPARTLIHDPGDWLRLEMDSNIKKTVLPQSLQYLPCGPL